VLSVQCHKYPAHRFGSDRLHRRRLLANEPTCDPLSDLIEHRLGARPCADAADAVLRRHSLSVARRRAGKNEHVERSKGRIGACAYSSAKNRHCFPLPR